MEKILPPDVLECGRTFDRLDVTRSGKLEVADVLHWRQAHLAPAPRPPTPQTPDPPPTSPTHPSTHRPASPCTGGRWREGATGVPARQLHRRLRF